MSLHSSHILAKLFRIVKFLFIFFVIVLLLMNIILVNIYNSSLKGGEYEDRIKVSSSLKWPAARTSYIFTNLTFSAKEQSTLLNMSDFRFVLNHADKCKTDEHIFMIIFVHSAVGNFAKRDAIRKTWASADNLRNNNFNQIRVIFLVGQSSNASHGSQIEREDKLYGDIIEGNFIDSYRNMTYKHVMGLKWVTYFCRNARYVFKADDDIFVDLFQLTYYLKGTFGDSPQNLIACFLNKNSWANRSWRNKWRVSYQEYSQKRYPQYCSGWGIIMTPDVVLRLYQAARSRPYFWIDDVFISGILAQDLKINHTDLGHRVTIDDAHVGKWLQKSELSLPPIFGFPDSATSQIYLLWNKTSQYYKTKFNHTFN